VTVTEPAPGAPAATDLDLLRAFEPVVRLTQGEFFVPVGVDAYVRHATLWQQAPDGQPELVAEPGALDLDSLARVGATFDGPGLSLSGITVPTSRWARIAGWRHTEHPSFRAGARLAQVGLLGRTIDTLSRFSLLLRGAVPGGSASLSYQAQTDHLDPQRPTYIGRVVRDAGYIVCQYWFFYAFNNWRSGFSGVNEHEADWEQVTVYLDGMGAPDEAGLPLPRWVVFSAHDETGDDLRRRWDDPDLGLVDGRHPVVYAGAGSHSGAYLAGDYLITVAPPTLGGLVPFVRGVAKIFTPWTRAAQGSGLGIPYIDYARGDGLSIGPGQQNTWHPVVVDDDTAWVRDYRGLWGHDTRDRLGGERGPAGPRYERDGTVRASWGDPVGWAGLAKVAPNPDDERAWVAQRIAAVDQAEQAAADQAASIRDDVRARAAGLPVAAPPVRALEPEERSATTARLDAVRLADERLRLERVLADGQPSTGPHDHLRHRRTPIAASDRSRRWLLNAWAVVSTPLVLWLLSGLFNPDLFERWQAAIGLLVTVVAVEAFARGYLLAFLWRLFLFVVALGLASEIWDNWQVVASIGLAVLAVIVLVVNLRDALRH
jgi:hypothetical protein